MVGIDLDDTTGCPVAVGCESCGDPLDLYTVTASSGMGGVLCLTLCAACCERPLPMLPVVTAALRTGEHCEHLGIDLDEMAAVMGTGAA